jgi:hypothetical protein
MKNFQLVVVVIVGYSGSETFFDKVVVKLILLIGSIEWAGFVKSHWKLGTSILF